MKKIIISLLAMLMLQAMPSQAQLKFGLKGGINVTNMKFNKEVLDAKNQSGFFIGPTVKFKLPLVGLGFDVAALYDQREAEFDPSSPASDEQSHLTKIKQKSINVPINLRYTIGLGDLAGIYLAAGPQFGFNVGDKNFGENFKMKNSNFSVNVGGGVRLLNHLEIGATYNIACGKTGDGDFKLDNIEMKSNAWQISAAYYF